MTVIKPIAVLLAGGLVAAALGAMVLVPGETARTADHNDPPARTSASVDSTPDRAADMADVYVWVEGDNLNLIVTFAGPEATTLPATYDRDVLYRLLLSTDGNPLSTENTIKVRFGFDGADNVGVQATDIPGVGTIEGPVEQDLTRDGATLRAGLFDDPFFFDIQGFNETRDTGTVRFNPNRNGFANANVTAFVVQFPLANLNATGDITVWADTLRFGGQL